MDFISILAKGREENKKDEDILQEVYCILLARLKNMKIEEFSNCVKSIKFQPAIANYIIELNVSSEEP